MWRGKLFGKRTWLGFTAGTVLLLLWIMVGALLVTGGILPITLREQWLLAGCLLSSLLGGAVAVQGGGERLRAVIPGLLLYALLWIIALASSAPLDFQARGLKITVCILCGGVIAVLFSGRGKRKRRKNHKTMPARKR